MLDSFTHRGRNVLIIFLLSLIALMIAFGTGRVTQEELEAWSTPIMLFYVLPLGIYILTDQERVARLNNSKQE